MVALVFEAYGALCCFALAVFLAWAAVAKLRPDLDEEEFDLAELEKLRKPVSLEPFGDALSIEPPIMEEPSWSSPAVSLDGAAVAKLRPNLDEEEFDLAELEKLKKLVSLEPFGDALSIEPPIIEEPSWSPPGRRQSRASVPSEGARTSSIPATLARSSLEFSSRSAAVQVKVMTTGLCMSATAS